MQKILLSTLCLLMLVLLCFGTALALPLDAFKAKWSEFHAGKVKSDVFIAICTDTLAKDVGDNKEFAALAYALRAEAYRRSKKPEKALPDAQKAVEIFPERKQGHITLFLTLQDLGKLEEAANALDIAAKYADEDTAKKYAQEVVKLRNQARAVTAFDLWKAFDANEVAAEDQYKGKPIAVKGKIVLISTDAAGNPVVSLDAGQNGLARVNCVFDKKDRSTIAVLKKGQQVLIPGVCAGMVMRQVFLKECKIKG